MPTTTSSPRTHSAQSSARLLDMALAGIDDINSQAPSSFHLDDLPHQPDLTGRRTDQVSLQTRSTPGVAMTSFAAHRDTVESFVDAMHGGADKDARSGVLAEDVALYSPLGDEPTTGRDGV